MAHDYIVEKAWGQERVLNNDDDYCMKELTLEQGWQSSLHMHRVKRETFLVTAGVVELELDGHAVRLLPGGYVTIEPGQWHRFRARRSRCTIIEASTKHRDDDVYREEESRII